MPGLANVKPVTIKNAAIVEAIVTAVLLGFLLFSAGLL